MMANVKVASLKPRWARSVASAFRARKVWRGIHQIMFAPDVLPTVQQWAYGPTRKLEVYTVREGENPESRHLGHLYVQVDLISVVELSRNGPRRAAHVPEGHSRKEDLD